MLNLLFLPDETGLQHVTCIHRTKVVTPVTRAIEAMVKKNQISLSPIDVWLLISILRLTESTTFVKV